MKQCSVCKQYKELSEFVKRGTSRRNICKACYNLRKRKTPIKPKPQAGYKICAACGREKPLSAFNIRYIAGKHRPFSYCKECEREKNNNRYAHKCAKCGKIYHSGKKDSAVCKECKNIALGAAGAERLRARNAVPENNPWYGKPRYGAENPNYNPEKTDEERVFGRILPGYKEWVRAVYERDKYTCQCCGDNTGHNLNAHHLDGYNWCREKRTDVSNGVTLCEKCHTNFHKIYGFRNNTKEQYAEFKQMQFNMLIPR